MDRKFLMQPSTFTMGNKQAFQLKLFQKSIQNTSLDIYL